MTAVNLIGSYNYALVALSVLIAMFASYAALDLAGRVTAAGGWTRAVWLLGGAGAMGTGIWSMHYIGMLAFILPIPVAYHWPTVLSLLAAILASVIALYVVSRKKAGGVALHLSEEWYRIYGFDPENSPPTFEERQQRTHPEDRAKWQEAIDLAIAEKSGYEEEFRILLPDGSR